ncbi:MAG: MBL fold metallo-hydrolase [Patescibacteria group bacterium]
MHISWLGTTAVKIQTKPLDADVTIVIDPYRPAQGEFPRSLAPDIALFTRGMDGAITLSGNPFVLSTAGECETKGVLITCVEGESEGCILARLDAENLSIAHLGLIKKELTEKHLDVVGGVDILLVPVGGSEGYDAESAMKAVNAIEPRIVIPIACKSENDPSYDPVSAFLKEMGAASERPEKKIIIKKKDLPQEETKVMVLEKE